MDSQEKSKIITDNPSVTVRPILVRFVKRMITEARELTAYERHTDGERGHVIVMELATALLWQVMNGYDSSSDGWLNEKDEPVLYEIFNTTGSLDGTPSQEGEWDKLFNLVDELV